MDASVCGMRDETRLAGVHAFVDFERLTMGYHPAASEILRFKSDFT